MYAKAQQGGIESLGFGQGVSVRVEFNRAQRGGIEDCIDRVGIVEKAL